MKTDPNDCGALERLRAPLVQRGTFAEADEGAGAGSAPAPLALYIAAPTSRPRMRLETATSAMTGARSDGVVARLASAERSRA